MSKQPVHIAKRGDLDDCRVPLVNEPLSADQAERLAPSFKALGDPIRLRLLSLIASHEGGEACVCDLTEGFDVSAPTISHHLKVLKEIGLVSADRRGTWVYYRAEPAALALLSTVLSVPQGAGV
jgi:ArsR family transcriptional regulator